MYNTYQLQKYISEGTNEWDTAEMRGGTAEDGSIGPSHG